MSGPGEGPASESISQDAAQDPFADAFSGGGAGGAGSSAGDSTSSSTSGSSSAAATNSLDEAPASEFHAEVAEKSLHDKSFQTVDSAEDNLYASDSSDLVESILKRAIKNPNSEVAVIGKITKAGPSYFEIADRMNAAHFFLDDWESAVREYGFDLIWEANVQFLIDQTDRKHDIILTQDPYTEVGTFIDEVALLEYLGYTFARQTDCWIAVPQKF